MNLESPKVIVGKHATEVFEFLAKVENFEKIMPENTDKFEIRDNGFLFALKGMPDIKVRMHEHDSSDKVVLVSANDQFPFTLIGNINHDSEDSSEVQFAFTGKFNFMMEMMIKGPLQKFINALSENIQDIK